MTSSKPEPVLQQQDPAEPHRDRELYESENYNKTYEIWTSAAEEHCFPALDTVINEVQATMGTAALGAMLKLLELPVLAEGVVARAASSPGQLLCTYAGYAYRETQQKLVWNGVERRRAAVLAALRRAAEAASAAASAAAVAPTFAAEEGADCGADGDEVWGPGRLQPRPAPALANAYEVFDMSDGECAVSASDEEEFDLNEKDEFDHLNDQMLTINDPADSLADTRPRGVKNLIDFAALKEEMDDYQELTALASSGSAASVGAAAVQ